MLRSVLSIQVWFYYIGSVFEVFENETSQISTHCSLEIVLLLQKYNSMPVRLSFKLFIVSTKEMGTHIFMQQTSTNKVPRHNTLKLSVMCRHKTGSFLEFRCGPGILHSDL